MYHLIILMAGMIMLDPDPSSFHADAIYRQGPETLAAAATTIAFGPIAGYSKQVESRSGDGPDAIPTRWTVIGRIERPVVLKGQAPAGSVAFSRPEHSIFLPPDGSAFPWEADYGEIAPDDNVVLFFGPGARGRGPRAVPSGDGDRDLIGLVRDVVRIQATVGAQARADQWLAYLGSAPTDERRKAALRSLVAIPIDWARFEPVLRDLLRNPRLGQGIRAFGFGIAAWGVTREAWGADRQVVVEFLGRTFAAEPDPELALLYAYSLELILAYADDEDFRAARQPVRRQVADHLRLRPSLRITGGPAPEPESEEQYRELRDQYLNP